MKQQNKKLNALFVTALLSFLFAASVSAQAEIDTAYVDSKGLVYYFRLTHRPDREINLYLNLTNLSPDTIYWVFGCSQKSTFWLNDIASGDTVWRWAPWVECLETEIILPPGKNWAECACVNFFGEEGIAPGEYWISAKFIPYQEGPPSHLPEEYNPPWVPVLKLPLKLVAQG